MQRSVKRWMVSLSCLSLVGCGHNSPQPGLVHVTRKIPQGTVLQASDVKENPNASESVFTIFDDVQTPEFAVGKTTAVELQNNQALGYQDLVLDGKNSGAQDLSERFEAVYIASKDLKDGQKITKDDVRELFIHAKVVPSNIVARSKELVGSSVNHKIRSGKILLKTDLGPVQKSREEAKDGAAVCVKTTLHKGDLLRAANLEIGTTKDKQVGTNPFEQVDDASGLFAKSGIAASDVVSADNTSPLTTYLLEAHQK